MAWVAACPPTPGVSSATLTIAACGLKAVEQSSFVVTRAISDSGQSLSQSAEPSGAPRAARWVSKPAPAFVPWASPEGPCPCALGRKLLPSLGMAGSTGEQK